MNPEDIGVLIVVSMVMAVALAAYLAPTIIAFVRGHHYRWVILAINAIGGLTIIGYVAAFAWAVWPRETAFADPFVGDPISGDVNAGRQASQRRGEYQQAIATGEQWFVAISGQITGPLTRNELIEKVIRGDIPRTELAWREGMTQWEIIETLLSLP